MDKELLKQKETIHLLDGIVHQFKDESEKQKEVLFVQAQKLHQLLLEKRKVEKIVALQAKLLDESKQKKEFDKELYLFELFKNGTVEKPYAKLASRTSMSYTVNSTKNRDHIKKFIGQLISMQIIQVVSNATISLVNYDEAQRLLEKSINKRKEEKQC